MLCRACQTIFTDGSYEAWPGWWSTWNAQFPEDPTAKRIEPEAVPGITHQTQEELSKAAVEGCWICVRLLKCDWKDPLAPVRYLIRITERGAAFCTIDFFRDFDQTKDNFRMSVRAELVPLWSNIHQLAQKSLLQGSTGHEDVMKLAVAWLADCLNNHPGCSHSVSGEWAPTRLLDISGARIRLLSSKEEIINGPYATLSHCWGTEEFPVLTSDNLTTFQAGVPFESFPLSFQEAIIIARNLGLRYIWIDSYCIIQRGDDDDWKREAPQMAQVYSGGIVNIAAADASNPTEGIFRTRDTPWSRTTHIQWKATGNQERMWYSLKTLSMDRFKIDPLEEVFMFELGAMHMLMHRGWVVQERALSRRMLSFARREIFWQCSEAAATESWPYKRPSKMGLLTHDPFWALTPSDILLRYNRTSQDTAPLLGAEYNSIFSKRGLASIHQFDADFKGTLQQRWFEFLEAYNEKILTYADKDRFMAIEGVGTEMAKLTGDVYSHGVLADTLPQALLWEAQTTTISTAIAPTWHWASVPMGLDGELSFSSVQKLYQEKWRGLSSFAPLAHVFMVDECRSWSSVASSTTEFWPWIMCLGRLLRVEERSSNTKKLRQSGAPFKLHTGDDIKLGVVLNVSPSQLSGFKNLCLLPLIMEYKLKREKTQVEGKSPWFLDKEISGIIVFEGETGFLRRAGCFSSKGDQLMKPLREAKPRLVVLE